MLDTLRTNSKSLRPLQVFLCHSSSDKPAVRELYERLQADGFKPWLDEEDLMPGQEWQIEIPKAIHNSDVCIVCLSQGSIDKRGYVQKEIRFALDAADELPPGSIYIIPLRLEECELPERLSRYQYADLFLPKGYVKLLSSLNFRAMQFSENILKHALPPHTEVIASEEKSGAIDTRKPLQSRFAKIILSRTGDGPTDAARIGEVHRILLSSSGKDRFCFIVQSHRGQLQLDFPNDTTNFTTGLIEQLRSTPGIEAVQMAAD
jgi:hypothetical protein